MFTEEEYRQEQEAIEAYNAAYDDALEMIKYILEEHDRFSERSPYGHGLMLRVTLQQELSEHFARGDNGQNKKEKIGSSLRRKVFERDKYRCKHCDTHISLSVDHIHPESKGGTLDMDNLQTLCRSCNSKKGTSIQ